VSRVPTLLVAWELGANLGHLMPLRSLMLEARNLSCRIVFAPHDLTNVDLLPASTQISLMQAPVWPATRRAVPPRPPSTYADILGGLGFGRPDRLAVMLRAWDSLVEAVKPDAIIADHSPGLILSMIGKQVPVMAVGSAYTMPPLEKPRLPHLRPELASPYPEEDILHSINAVLRGRGHVPFQSLTETLKTDGRAVFGLAALDPYATSRQEELLLPPEGASPPASPPLTPHLFAYLPGGSSNIDAIVQALSRLDVKITAYVRGDAGPVTSFLEMRGHRVLARPPSLADLLPSVSHVFSSAGAFTCQAALLAGRPHIMMPLQHEAAANARMVEKLGSGIVIRPNAVETALGRAVEAAIADKVMQANAMKNAQQIWKQPQASGSDAVMIWLSRVLNSAPYAAM
jgi:rhamnosyltransferase subunit B